MTSRVKNRLLVVLVAEALLLSLGGCYLSPKDRSWDPALRFVDVFVVADDSFFGPKKSQEGFEESLEECFREFGRVSGIYHRIVGKAKVSNWTNISDPFAVQRDAYEVLLKKNDPWRIFDVAIVVVPLGIFPNWIGLTTVPDRCWIFLRGSAGLASHVCQHELMRLYEEDGKWRTFDCFIPGRR